MRLLAMIAIIFSFIPRNIRKQLNTISQGEQGIIVVSFASLSVKNEKLSFA